MCGTLIFMKLMENNNYSNIRKLLFNFLMHITFSLHVVFKELLSDIIHLKVSRLETVFSAIFHHHVYRWLWRRYKLFDFDGKYYTDDWKQYLHEKRFKYACLIGSLNFPYMKGPSIQVLYANHLKVFISSNDISRRQLVQIP